MIRLERSRQLADLHPDFTGAKLEQKLLDLAEARIAHGDDIAFEKALGDWKKTKDVLKRDSYDKCAYCEALTAVVAHGDVEHFRPKSTYWWLALCIDNYVYSCQICNQTYKSDHFPIRGRMIAAPKLPRAIPRTANARKKLAARIAPDPAVVDEALLLREWLAEDPDLPHPYLENPEPLFGWKVVETNQEVLLVAPPRPTARARRAVQAAVDYLGLNRETLTRARYSVYNSLFFALKVWRNETGPLKADAADAIRGLCDSRAMFAGMNRFFARQAGFRR